MTTAPRRASRPETVDLPDPMPPVRPRRSTGRTVSLGVIASWFELVISGRVVHPKSTVSLLGIAFQRDLGHEPVRGEERHGLRGGVASMRSFPSPRTSRMSRMSWKVLAVVASMSLVAAACGGGGSKKAVTGQTGTTAAPGEGPPKAG